MVAKIKVDILERADGSAVELTKQSAAKCWGFSDNNGALLGGMNVSSMTDQGAGLQQFNFAHAMANVNASGQVCGVDSDRSSTNASWYERTTREATNIKTICQRNDGANIDGTMSVAVFGDLA